MLGTGKQEAEPRLLVLMLVQKDKYEKWLFRVLVVLSQLLVRKTTSLAGLFVSFPCFFRGDHMEVLYALRSLGTERIRHDFL